MDKLILLLCTFFLSDLSWSACVSGNCINGQGTYIWADGQKYEGQFKKGKRDGKGSHFRADGSKYVGQFKNDRPIPGRGIDYLYDGRQLVYHKYSTAELKDANGNIIRSYVTADEITVIRKESATIKRLDEEQLTRQKQAEERHVSLVQLQDKIQITAIQRKLIDHSYLSGTADGIAGADTGNALTQFYKDAGLKMPSLEELDVIASDLTDNLLRKRGSCALEPDILSLFVACFTINK